MGDNTIAARRQQLQAMADERGIDWRARISGLPEEDDNFVVAVLASLLGLNVRLALDDGTTMDELTRYSEERRAGEIDREVIQRYVMEMLRLSGVQQRRPES
jgi:hypothetical protein